MKLISLNTWGGRVHKPLMDFFTKNQDIDIFCLQEVYHNAPEPIVEDKGDRLNLLSEIHEVLPNHTMYFKGDTGDYFGQAIFVNKDITVHKEGDVCMYESTSTERGNHSRHLLFVEIESNNAVFTIANVHGLWNGQGKGDSEDRLEQSRRIKKFIDSTEGNKIVCGDFNLLPDTESIKIIESTGMSNLIANYGIASTRTALYNKHINPVLYADYMFTTASMYIKEFKVLPDEVSDHAALYIEI